MGNVIMSYTISFLFIRVGLTLGGRAIKSVSLGSASATVRGRPKLVANTSGGFEASHALRSWAR